MKNWYNENSMWQNLGTKETWLMLSMRSACMCTFVDTTFISRYRKQLLEKCLFPLEKQENAMNNMLWKLKRMVLSLGMHLTKSVTCLFSFSKTWIKNSVHSDKKMKAFIQQRYLAGLFTVTSIGWSKSVMLGGSRHHRWILLNSNKLAYTTQ